ncbi:LysR family transcriptional regulator [Pandoraea anhela]|uniref:LysR family transcriptional regulator n=1 Tax=Pandoraea anhela TaxID=2508295 RepID=A0A5E4WQ98_9BURK|nr:LysR family transcriptional regulator [Pandoraea anhela]VVE26393.1 LysR family transcriptional regulator [Pandoraea anhela]
MVDASLLGALRSFTMAARLLSFTRAAEALSLTQSAISQQVRLLERRLGYPLFVRGHRSLTLTAEGAMLLEGAQRAFEEIESTLARISDSGEPVKVGCCPSFAMHWLVSRLSQYHHHYERNPVQLMAEFAALGVATNDATQVDAAVRYCEDEPTGAGRSTALFDEWLIPVASPAYIERHPKLAEGKLDASCVLLHDAFAWPQAETFAEWRVWIRAIRPAWVRHVDGPRFNIASMAYGAALNHQGIAIGRASMLMEELADGRLVPVLPVAVRSPAAYWVVAKRPEAPATGAFEAWLIGQSEQFVRRRATELTRMRIDLVDTPD